MISDNLFDILIEIRKIDSQISDVNLKVGKSQQELLDLQKNIDNVKGLQLKALSFLKDSERKEMDTQTELQQFHTTYKNLIGYIDRRFVTKPIGVSCNIDELKKERDDLQNKLLNIRKEKEELARKVNEVDLQMTIQIKKNAAEVQLLEKNLEVLLEEEKNLQMNAN